MANRLAIEAHKYLAAGDWWQAAQWVAESHKYDIENARAREALSQLQSGGHSTPKEVPLTRQRRAAPPQLRWVVLLLFGLIVLFLGLAILFSYWQTAQA